MPASPSISSDQRRSTSLTPQQLKAIACRDVSVVLSSGAGCGKTHVLTERYLSHLRDGDAEVSQIVAITFTERAARQMRQRIRQAVTDELRAAATDTEAERWHRHLRALEAAPISTIHAFCGNLLRQYAVEIGLDPNFDILEDVLSTNLEADALTDCLQSLLTADTLEGKDLRELVLLYGWRPVVNGVEHLMRTDDSTAGQAWLDRPPEQTASAWKELARGALRPLWIRHLLRAKPKVVHCLELLRTVLPLPDTKVAGRIGRLIELIPQMAEAEDLEAVVNELKVCAKVGAEREKAWPSEDAYKQVKKAFLEFREELRRQLALFYQEPEKLTEAAIVGQRFLRVAVAAAHRYREYKQREAVIDFQDLLTLTRDLLRDHADIRARLQKRYRVLLIDELQDTDPKQVHLVESLCGGGLATGKLFAVGDHKQSIYRFRGADVTRFQELRQRMPHEGRLELTGNFRSQPAIIGFTNALLASHMTDYEPLAAQKPQVNAGACIEFLWSPCEEDESVTSSRKTEADWIARRISGMIGGERLVVDRAGGESTLRPVKQGDVVLLFRSMTNAHLYEAALRQHGLDYYLVGGRAFFAQQEIYDLLNLLRTLENPQDDLSLAGILRSPFCCVSDEALFLLSRHPGGLWAGLQDGTSVERLPPNDRQPLERARQSLNRWRSLKDRLPIVRLIGEVFADSAYDAATQFEFLGDRKLANLWKLMELARTFDRSRRFGLAEFIQRLGDLVRSQPREEQAATQPENADVIRLMTIHQAKGLEFPVVFVPDMAWEGRGASLPAAHWNARLGCVVRPPVDEDPPPFGDFGWRLWRIAEEMEEWHEDLRTLYVACTRAEDYLVLSAALPEKYRPGNAWMITLAEEFNLRDGRHLVETRPNPGPPIRVIDYRAPLPHMKAPPRIERVSAEALDGWEAGIAPIPIRSTATQALTVFQWEELLTRDKRSRVDGLDATDGSGQFDTEDGADRAAWVSPRARLASSFNGDDMARFASSPMCQTLMAAKVHYCDLEFVTAVSMENSSESEPRWVRGILDGLWQDDGGDWHLLAFSNASAADCDGEWERRKPALALAARAVQETMGSWPRTVKLYHLSNGKTSEYAGADLEWVSLRPF
jgi:ATP-dependent helicase/nuclease subunit A